MPLPLTAMRIVVGSVRFTSDSCRKVVPRRTGEMCRKRSLPALLRSITSSRRTTTAAAC